MLLTCCLPLGGGFTVDEIEGSPSMEIIFNEEGHSLRAISIPRPFHLMSATMDISGQSRHSGGNLFPTNVTVDIGDDGEVEWAFDGQGYGPLGQQQVFDDGASIKEIHVQGATDRTISILVPSNGTIGPSEVSVTAIPTETVNASLALANQSLDASTITDFLLEGPTQTAILGPGTKVVLEAMVGIEQGVDIDQELSGYSERVEDNNIVAQSFVINASDPKQDHSRLYAIEVETSLTSLTPPYDLKISIFNVTDDGNRNPTGDAIVSELVSGSAIPDGAYMNVTFDPAPLLETGRPYAVVFEFTGPVGIDRVSLRGHTSMSGQNEDSSYPMEGCWIQTSSDGSSWTVNHDSDLIFRTHVDVARDLTYPEREAVTVDGLSATVPGVDMRYDMAEPDIGPQGWNFSVENGLSIPILYNLMANISFNHALEDLVVDLGNDSCPEVSKEGEYSGSMVVDITSGVTAAMAGGQGATDDHGISMVKVPVRVQATGGGTVRFENLAISYDRSFKVPGMAEAIADLQDGDTEGHLVVPVNVSSGGPGIVTLSGLNITFDGPPRPVSFPHGPIELPEEGHNETLVELGTMFEEDFDTELTYTIHNYSADGVDMGLLTLQVSQGYLDVNASEAVNWSGRIVVHVNATDDMGYTTTSSPINISVVDVNDPPVITSAPPTTAIADTLYEYHFSVVDSDSDIRDCWLVGAPEGMVVDLINMRVLWTPAPEDEGDHEFVLKVSDGEFEVFQQVRMSVLIYGPGNRPPTVEKVSNRTAVKGQAVSVQLDAIDPEGDNMTYSVKEGPEGLKVDNETGLVSWTSALVGNHTVIIRVSDGTKWTDVTFTISVLEEGTISVTIEHPQRGAKVPKATIIKGQATSTVSKVVKVQYRIDDGDWYDAELYDGGLWKAEPDLSNIGKGTHTLLVRATDDGGATAQNYTTFQVERQEVTPGPISGLASGPGLSFLFLMIAVMAVIVALAAWSYGRKGKKGTRKRAKAKAVKTNKAKKGTKDKVAEPVAKERPTTSRVDSAFLVYHDGRLITYSSISEIDDLDSTLQVIKDFVKASFKGEMGRLDALRYEDSNIILERGVQMYLVAMTSKEDVEDLRRDMRRFLNDVHRSYRSALKVWDGNFKKVKGIGIMVEKFVSGKWVPKEDPKEDPKAKRWDDSPDLDDRSTSNIEKLKALEDKLLRGEITEDEFERLSKRYK
jgi:hypothetical protein